MSDVATSPNAEDRLAQKTRDELNIIASKLKVPGYRKLTKEALTATLLSSDKIDLLKQLHITWWDRYHNHVYGVFSVVGVVLSVVFFVTPPAQTKNADAQTKTNVQIQQSVTTADASNKPQVQRKSSSDIHNSVTTHGPSSPVVNNVGASAERDIITNIIMAEPPGAALERQNKHYEVGICRLVTTPNPVGIKPTVTRPVITVRFSATEPVITFDAAKTVYLVAVTHYVADLNAEGGKRLEKEILESDPSFGRPEYNKLSQ